MVSSLVERCTGLDVIVDAGARLAVAEARLEVVEARLEVADAEAGQESML